MSTVRQAKISELIPDDRNANQGTERGNYALDKSISQYGAGRSILVDKAGRIISGNKTASKFGELGLEDVIVVQTDGQKLVAVQRTDLDLDSPEGRGLAIADNRVGELNLQWDAETLSDLNQEGAIDLDDWFTPDEFDQVLEGYKPDFLGEDDEEQVSDDIESADSGQIESRVKLGDIWSCGRHRIACGDSTDEGNIEKLLNGQSVGFVWADPPYGISIVATNVSVGGGEVNKIPFGGVKNETDKQREKRLGTVGGSKPFGTVGGGNWIPATKYAPIIGDDTIQTAVDSVSVALRFFPDAMHVWWGGNYYSNSLPNSNCWIVWDKENTGNFADAELAWTNSSTAVRIFKHMWNGLMKASERGERRVHPTQKPVALAEWCFEKYGKFDDLIFDPFLGSGMSIIAAQQMSGDRTIYGFELSSDYCEIILRRYEKLTGEAAELAGHL